MKFSLFPFFVILFLPSLTKAEVQIQCIVKSTEEYNVQLYIPVNNNYNLLFLDRALDKKVVQLNKTSFKYSFTLSKPFFIDIFLYTLKKEYAGRLQLLVFPDDDLNIIFDFSKEAKQFSIVSGNNSAGHNLFSRLNGNPGEKFRLVDSLLNDFPENSKTLISQIETQIDNYLTDFILLKRENKVSSEYFRILKKNLKMNLYDHVVRRMLTPTIKNQSIEKSIRNEIVETIFDIFPISDNEIKQLGNSYLFYMDYLRFLTYKKFNYTDIEEIVNAPNDTVIGKEKLVVPKDYSFVLHSDKKSLTEDIWALSIGVRLRFAPGQYDISVIDQFNLIFPNSKWNLILNEQFKQYSKVDRIAYRLQMPITIIDSVGEIETIKEITKKLPGSRYFFVDCWATWCAPCIGAFSYNNVIDSFLNKRGIARLYISIDIFENKKYWLRSVQTYKLGGYHIISDERLVEDIQRLLKIPKDSPFYIPRYFLVDSKRNIIHQDIPTPSNTEDFIKHTNAIVR